jgi:hypothetical protein
MGAHEVVKRILRVRDIVKHTVGRTDLVGFPKFGQRALVAALAVQLNGLPKPDGSLR